jgi:hypothetical protein
MEEDLLDRPLNPEAPFSQVEDGGFVVLGCE